VVTHTILYTILYILYYIIYYIYYTILHYTILHYTILYYTMLYYNILYYTMLYYTYTPTPLKAVPKPKSAKAPNATSKQDRGLAPRGADVSLEESALGGHRPGHTPCRS
jgi:hypothetical protein